MSREPQVLELEGVTVSSAPLPYERSEDILPEVGQLVALVLEKAAVSLSKGVADLTSLKKMDVVTLANLLAPVLASVADKLGNGTLKRLAPLILASTEVVMVMADGKKERKELMKPSDRADVFNEHPEAYFPILFHAGKVTFTRYFPAAVQSLLTKTAVAG